MGKLTLGSKDSLKSSIKPNKGRKTTLPLNDDQVITPKENQTEKLIEREIQFIEKPVYITKEVLVEVPIIKEVIVERKEEIPVFKEVIKEIRVEVPVEVVKEVEKIVKIPVITRVKYVPKWVNFLFWFEIVKYIGLVYWLMVK